MLRKNARALRHKKRLIVRYGQPFYGSSYMSEMKICAEIT
jgi:hypothetical protein